MSLWCCNRLSCSFLSCIISLVVWVYLAKLHGPVQAGRLFTRKSILRKVTSQCLLVEHGGITAEETPLCSFNYLSFIVLNRKADVENLKYWMIIDPPSPPPPYLTPALHICIIPICLALTTETVHIRISKNFFMSCWEAARSLLGEDQPYD